MFVRNRMSSPAVTIPPEVPVSAARAFMERRKIRRLPVVEAGKLLGILTLSDTQAAKRQDAFVADVMTRKPLTVEPTDTLERAAKLMLDRQVSGLPVVEDGAVVGILTESDVFRAFCELMGVGERGARVVFTVPEKGDLLETVKRRLSGLTPRSLATFHNPDKECWEVVTRVRGRR